MIIRYESAGKFKESDELVFHGIENMNKYNQVTGLSVFLTCRLSLHMIWLSCISTLSKHVVLHLRQKLEVVLSSP